MSKGTLVDEFVKYVSGPTLDETIVFTPEKVKQIGQDFNIPEDALGWVGEFLEVGAYQWSRETTRSALDFKKIQKELKDLGTASAELAKALENLSPETCKILVETGLARELGGFPLPRVSSQETSTMLNYSPPSSQEFAQVTLPDIQNMASALGECAVGSLRAAKKSPKGRPDDGGLFDFLHIGFHIWESILGREFKLDWHTDHKPITDAAQFCVRIVHCVQPDTPANKIANKAREAREKGMKISNLEELPQVIEHYRKLFE